MATMKNKFEMLSRLISPDHSSYLLLSLGNINHKVHWEDMKREEGIQIPYSGMPFTSILLGYDVRECHFGTGRNAAIKKRINGKGITIFHLGILF